MDNRDIPACPPAAAAPPVASLCSFVIASRSFHSVTMAGLLKKQREYEPKQRQLARRNKKRKGKAALATVHMATPAATVAIQLQPIHNYAIACH